jgi:uncharacterized protein YecE (DUF72 family)
MKGASTYKRSSLSTLCYDDVTMSLFIGCPIWSFRGWVGNFYPEGTKPSGFLREYARRLTAIEGNTTFYAVPAQKSLEQWAASTPQTFRFCPKVPKAISHAGSLAKGSEAAQQFVDFMHPLGDRLGAMFLQLPPRYSPQSLEDLGAFLKAWPREQKLAVEVRHHGWYDEPYNSELNRILSRHKMARVVIDTRPIRSLDGDDILKGSVYQSLLEARKRKPNVPALPERTADFLFLRFIGHPRLEFNSRLLDEWSSYLASQLRGSDDAYIFCHSPDNLAAPWICRDLYRRVATQVDLTPLPWEAADSTTFEQERLL